MSNKVFQCSFRPILTSLISLQRAFKPNTQGAIKCRSFLMLDFLLPQGQACLVVPLEVEDDEVKDLLASMLIVDHTYREEKQEEYE